MHHLVACFLSLLLLKHYTRADFTFSKTTAMIWSLFASRKQVNFVYVVWNSTRMNQQDVWCHQHFQSQEDSWSWCKSISRWVEWHIKISDISCWMMKYKCFVHELFDSSSSEVHMSNDRLQIDFWRFFFILSQSWVFVIFHTSILIMNWSLTDVIQRFLKQCFIQEW